MVRSVRYIGRVLGRLYSPGIGQYRLVWARCTVARTRVEKLGEAIMLTQQWHDDPVVRARRQSRLPGLVERFQKEWLVPECPRCNSRECELTENPVAVGGKVIRVCHNCLKEVLAERRGFVPVYTKV